MVNLEKEEENEVTGLQAEKISLQYFFLRLRALSVIITQAMSAYTSYATDLFITFKGMKIHLFSDVVHLKLSIEFQAVFVSRFFNSDSVRQCQCK